MALSRDNHDRGIPAYILDDLSTRFLNNLPEQEYSDLVRVFFQVEQAYWFFLDFYCNKSGVKPCAIKEFSEQIFRHCPVLVVHYGSYEDILRSWREYKLTVPRYGVIILDPLMEQCLLVRGCGPHSSWTFPKGKINEGESEVDCAIRETEEEIGFDSSNRVDPNCFLEHKLNDQYNKLYIIKDVALDTDFQTKTRNEIGAIKWWPIDQLPAEHGNNHFLFVYPFVKKLRAWVNSQKRAFGGNLNSKRQHRSAFTVANSAGGSEPKRSQGSSRRNSGQFPTSAGTGPGSSRRERKYATPVISGLGRGRHAPRYSLVAGGQGGSENDDDHAIITRPGGGAGVPHQPYQQAGSQTKKPQQEASPVPMSSLFPGQTGGSKKRQSKLQRQRNSLSGGTSGEGGDEAGGGNSGGSKKEAITVGPIAISALGLVVQDEVVSGGEKSEKAEKTNKNQEADADAETDTQPHDPVSNEDEDEAVESDDEDEGDDESGGISPDDARILAAAAAENRIAVLLVPLSPWEKFVPDCWKNFSFDRSLICEAWNGKD